MKNHSLCSPIKPLLPGFTNHLDIPVTFFLKHLEGCNEGRTVDLRTDASEITWKVKMDGRRLSDGWKNFVCVHDLRVGDIVVFRHEGELVFHVSAFGPSFCEIQYQEDSHEEDKTETEKVCEIEKVLRTKKSPETEADSSTDQSCFVVNVTDSNLRRDTRKGEEYVSTESNTKEVHSSISTNQNRFVTIKLTPTSFKTCRLSLPSEFTKGNGVNRAGKITMLDRDGARWTTSLLMDHNKRGTMSIGRGWKGFCEVNDVKMDESFVLELVWEDTVPVLRFCSKG